MIYINSGVKWEAGEKTRTNYDDFTLWVKGGGEARPWRHDMGQCPEFQNTTFLATEIKYRT